MSAAKLLVIFLVISVFVVSSIFVFKAFASSEDAASLAISQAEQVLASAFEAVLEAERAGANVSGLLVMLNDAGVFLAKAQVAYRLGDFEEAVGFADLCYEIGEGVKGKAGELRVEAYGPRVIGFWLTMAGSLVGVVAVGVGSVWGWRFFKRRYYRHVLRMKPEVSSDES
jgi:hypothetical protein